MDHLEKIKSLFCFIAVLAAALVISEPAAAKVPAAPKGTVRLPYNCPDVDSFGNRWYVDPGGNIRQVGNMAVFSEVGSLIINGNQVGANGNSARIDDNGDFIFDNLQTQNCQVVRRIQFNKTEGYVRIVDIIKNTQGHEQQISLQYRSSVNYGIQGIQVVTDSHGKDQSLGDICLDGQGRNAVDVYGGHAGKQMPEVSGDNNGNGTSAQFSLAIKPGKEIAIAHIHFVAANNDAGVKFINSTKESVLFKDLPAPIRKLIGNFSVGAQFIGDEVEILRGEAFDVVELRGGDSCKGTLKQTSWKLTTFYGPVELGADRVVALINVGEARPRQLLVTQDGEIYGGTLDAQTIPIELSSGQVTQIPLSQITRVGYRRRAGEPEEWTFDKPIVVLRSGDRISVEMPGADVPIATRYGQIKLKSQSIAAINLVGDDTGLPVVSLTDGSHFTGLLVQNEFELKLASTAGNPVVHFPASSIAKLQWTTKIDDIDETTAQFKLVGDDVLIGHLAGKYKLETAFDAISLDGSQIKKIVHSKTTPADVQVTMWDDTLISGQLAEQELTCQPKDSPEIKIPLALLSEYSQPVPSPSDETVKRVAEVVKRLNSDDWKDRDAAQSELTAMGPAIAGVLKDQRIGQPVEAQQRIDAVLTAFKAAAASGKGGNHPAPPAMNPGMMDN